MLLSVLIGLLFSVQLYSGDAPAAGYPSVVFVHSPGMDAIRTNQLERLHEWTAKTADVNNGVTCWESETDSDGEVIYRKCPVPCVNTPLMRAALDNKIEAVNILLTSPRLQLYLQDELGRTALHYAAMNGHYSVVRRLCADKRSIGGFVSVRDNDKRLALSYAALNGHSDVVKFLLQQTQPDYIDLQDAIDQATLHKHHKLAEILSSKIIPVTPENIENYWKAARDANYRHIAGLVKIISIDRQDSEGNTALHHFVQKNDDQYVPLLIKCLRASVSIQNKQGRTVLMQAVVLGHEGIAQYLINNCNIDYQLADADGHTVYELEERYNKAKIVSDIDKCIAHRDIQEFSRFIKDPQYRDYCGVNRQQIKEMIESMELHLGKPLKDEMLQVFESFIQDYLQSVGDAC